MKPGGWRLYLGETAEADLADILAYSTATFGPIQAEVYKATLIECLTALEFGPHVIGSVDHSKIGPNLRSLHVARNGRRGRHFILYRPIDEQIIEVIRILHDAMDLARHVPDDVR